MMIFATIKREFPPIVRISQKRESGHLIARLNRPRAGLRDHVPRVVAIKYKLS